MEYASTPTPTDDDTVAAALAAVYRYIAHEQTAPVPSPTPRSAWRAAAAIEAQGLSPARNGAHCAWGSVARASRAQRWSFGVLGI